MTNSTIQKNQVMERFSNATKGIVISSERITKSLETNKTVHSPEVTAQKNAERERMYWIQQKLSQRSYVSGYRGL